MIFASAHRIAAQIDALSGHLGTSGIQKHSCGPIFPFHVVQRGNALWAMHADGTSLRKHFFGKGQQTSHEAHRAADEDARRWLLNKVRVG